MIHLVLGGARSGKSAFASRLLADKNPLCIVTAVACDDEMQERIEKHKYDRPKSWHVIEEPYHLTKIIDANMKQNKPILIDCLTVWLSNLMVMNYDMDSYVAEFLQLLTTLPSDKDYIFVANELGWGLVPETPLGRKFRDEHGRLTQKIAEIADNVTLVVAGLPIILKN